MRRSFSTVPHAPSGYPGAMKNVTADSRKPRAEGRPFWAALLVLLLSAAPACGQGIITTVAGGQWVFRGDGSVARQAALGRVSGIGADWDGNVYVGDTGNHIIARISSTGVLSVVAGNGIAANSGDGGPATSASLSLSLAGAALCMDSDGNIYVVSGSQIRRIDRTGRISVVAGSLVSGPLGDGGPARDARFKHPSSVAVDARGNIYVADLLDHRVRKIDAQGTITTFAGTGVAGNDGDEGPATAARIDSPNSLAVDSAGSVFIGEYGYWGNKLRKVTPAGQITTVMPSVVVTSLAVDSADRLYMANGNCCVHRVDSDGSLTLVAGSGSKAPDGVAATEASLYAIYGIAFDPQGNLLIADSLNEAVRKVTRQGTIFTIAGNGRFKYAGDNGPATAASMNQPWALAFDYVHKVLYVGDTLNRSVRRIDSSGVITTALQAQEGSVLYPYFYPEGLALDSGGGLLITNNMWVYKMRPDGRITTFAGNGQTSGSGDGGPAINAALWGASKIVVDAFDNVYVSENMNHRVRKIDPSGIISTVAGNGTQGFSGDGGPATSASLYSPKGVALDAAGNLYIADGNNNRIRKVSPSGTISTAAGNGAEGFSGDGGPATRASLARPTGLAVDASGNLYIGDSFNVRIRKVSLAGTITTVAGNGVPGFSGDGGPATSASFQTPGDVAVDAAGNLYVADPYNDRIRKVVATPPAFSVAPAALKFAAPSGTAAAGAQQLAVSSTVTGLAWSAQASTESGGSWLSISPAAGTMPSAIAVSVDVSALAAATYRGTVTVTAPQAAQPTQTVSVELTVTAAPKPQLALEPGSLTFEAQAGGGNPAAQSLRISNAGTGTLAWTAEWHSLQAVQWLSVSPASGSASAGSPASVQVKVTASGLAAGVYSGSIRVDSSTTGETVTVPVTLLVAQVTQTILVSQSGLLFTGVQGADSAPSQTFGILNTGQGVMNWTVRSETFSGGSWLRVSSSSGRSDANSLEVPQVEVSVSVAGLRAGQYSGLIRVEAPGANNVPQYVSVDLTVLPTGSNPGVLLRPTGLIFAARAGTSSPGSQTVRLATAAPGSVGAVGGLLTYDGGAWLQALPTNLVLSPADPRNIVIQPALGTLAPGIYRAALTLIFGDGSPCQAVNVLFLVVGSAVRTASTRAEPEADGACTPGRLHAVHRTLGSSFSAPASWPTPIEVQVVDDCGTAVANATVVASFTNGDPPLALTSLRNGTYIGTWRPVNTATQAVVTVRASLPPLTPAEIQARGAVGTNAAAPALNSGGIVNGASFAPAAPLAPGSIISVFGANLATAPAGASSLPLPKTLAGASLQVGGLDVPLFYSSGGQVNAQLPFELALNTRPQLIVKGASFVTVPETITVAAARPGIFTMSQDGKGQGVIVDVNNRLVDASNPAAAGDVLVVYCTGLGATNPAVRSGEAAPAPPAPLARVVTPVSVTIGGQPAVVQFAGLTPGYAGLYQVNVQIPPGIAPGPSVSLVITQDGVPSNTVTLAAR